MTSSAQDRDLVHRWLEAGGRRELTLLLFVAWDPLRVNDDLEMWREYEPYADALAQLSLSEGEDEVCREMARITDIEMRMPTGFEPRSRCIDSAMGAHERGHDHLTKAAQKAASNGNVTRHARLMARSNKNLGKANATMDKHHQSLLGWLRPIPGTERLFKVRKRGVHVKIAYHDHAGGPHKGPHLQANGWQRGGAKGLSVDVRSFP